MIRLALLLVLLLAPLAYAVDSPSEMLPNPALEKRAEEIGSQLRCLVCQNESIEDSSADLAKDLRKIVRERVVAGDTDQQVIDWMVQRYGNFVRLKPPFDPLTWLLWFSPLIALAIGGIAAWLGWRRAAVPPTPLTEAERQRVAELTGSAETR
jgi:cytochrome c-type biogenesis protein CcmH